DNENNQGFSRQKTTVDKLRSEPIMRVFFRISANYPYYIFFGGFAKVEPTANSPDSGYLIINAEKEAPSAGANAALQEPSAKLLSEYHLQLSRLLHRIEDAATHYQVLGLKMAASYDDVVRAYYSILNLFYPAQQIRIALDEPII